MPECRQRLSGAMVAVSLKRFANILVLHLLASPRLDVPDPDGLVCAGREQARPGNLHRPHDLVVPLRASGPTGFSSAQLASG